MGGCVTVLRNITFKELKLVKFIKYVVKKFNWFLFDFDIETFQHFNNSPICKTLVLLACLAKTASFLHERKRAWTSTVDRFSLAVEA